MLRRKNFGYVLYRASKIIVCLVLIYMICFVNGSEAKASNTYDRNAALKYAQDNWNNGKGLCAEFVSNCINAGGSDSYSTSASTLLGYLKNSGMGQAYDIAFKSQRLIYMPDYVGKISAGDPVFFYCADCKDGKPYVHTVLCNGSDADGYMKAYSHNNANSGTTKYNYGSTCYSCGGRITKAVVFHFYDSVTPSSFEYNSLAALQYAKAHWNDGKGLCAEFVSDCIKQGGSSAYSLSTSTLLSQLKASNTGTAYDLKFSSEQKINALDYIGKLSPGDPIFYYCSGCTDGKPYVHVALCNGFDENDGFIKVYSHNNNNDGTSSYNYNSTCYSCGGKITKAVVYHFNTNYRISSNDKNVQMKSNETKDIKFNFHGDGIYRLGLNGDSSVVPGIKGIGVTSVDWPNCIGDLKIVAGESGNGNIYMSFIDRDNNVFYYDKLIYLTVDGHTHTMKHYSAKSATCTTAGNLEYYECSGCGKKYLDKSGTIEIEKVTIAAKGHTEVTVKGKAATCDTNGLSDGSKCSVCGIVIKAQSYIMAKGHTEVTVKGKAATCENSGLSDGSKCSVCGKIIKTQTTIPASGHLEILIKGKPATSTQSGLTDGSKCGLCGKIIKEQKLIPTLGNVFVPDNVVGSSDGTGNGETNINVEDIINVKMGWLKVGNVAYWYENGVKQGTYDDKQGVMGDGTIRGREIYDPESNGWYWLDACFDGAKAVNKEVWMPYIYQGNDNWGYAEIEMNASNSGDMKNQVIKAIMERTGKWVRYDENGKMFKGWCTIEGKLAEIYPNQAGNTYYYDEMTGLMAKGIVNIGGVIYEFDEITGVLKR